MRHRMRQIMGLYVESHLKHIIIYIIMCLMFFFNILILLLSHHESMKR